MPVSSAAIPVFQSTLSVRRATRHQKRSAERLLISIHALREESDSKVLLMRSNCSLFQSTLSVRRATVQLDISVRFLRRKPAA